MQKVVVTGGSGKAGRAVVRELLDHGYEVLNVDVVAPSEAVSPFVKADLAELGQTFEVLGGYDAVVHLAAIPAPGRYPEGETFRNNTMSTYNGLQRGGRAGATAGRVGFERDDAGPALRPGKTRLRPHRRGTPPLPGVQLRPIQDDLRGDGPAVRAHERRPFLRLPHLQHHGAPRLRALPRLLGRPPPAKVELVGLRGRPGRSPGLPPRPGGTLAPTTPKRP